MTRFIIAGTHSGCGKTTVTCAILQALINRGCDVASFKCGPDYIDPMFHSKIIGTASYNLDGFFCDTDTLNYLLNKNSRDISVIEGVMGFYDGVGNDASSRRLALDTATPVVIVIDCKGMSMSIGAVMKGFLEFQKPNNIAGFIFNRLPDGLIYIAKRLCGEMNVKYLGRLPNCGQCSVESRHLGLVTADEIAGLKEKMRLLAELAEQNILINDILEVGCHAKFVDFKQPKILYSSRIPLKIAVAYDNAFCFHYEDNLNLLRQMNCEIAKFAPLTDSEIPKGASGLILGGGYPELYAGQLSANKSILSEIRQKINLGMPTIAECGGFMYLHENIEGSDGKNYKMVGTIRGKVFKTQKLRRFGYVNLTSENDNLLCGRGETIPAHEFHYWDSDNCGESFTGRRASNGAEYRCIHAGENLYAGFPHLYFYANIGIAENFVRKCEEFALKWRG